jgi:hypothetical protein
MLAGRIRRTTRLADDFAAKAPHGLDYELMRLHYDIAGSADRSAMAALMNLVPTSQIVFGSDYPFVPNGCDGRRHDQVGALRRRPANHRP